MYQTKKVIFLLEEIDNFWAVIAVTHHLLCQVLTFLAFKAQFLSHGLFWNKISLPTEILKYSQLTHPLTFSKAQGWRMLLRGSGYHGKIFQQQKT